MENPNKAPRIRKKENRPPRLNRDATPEQRNIQKNVNINLSLDSFSDAAVSPRSSRAALPATNCRRAAAHGKPPVASIRGAEPHRRILVQTNLACPYPPSWDTPGGLSGGPSRQQSNLETRLGCRRSDNRARVGEPSRLPAVDLGRGCSCLNEEGLKNSPKNDFSGRRPCWSQKPREGLGLRGVPHSCNDISESGAGNKDPQVLKRPRGRFSMSEESCRTPGDSFCPANLYERPSAGSFLHGLCSCPESPGSSFSSSPPGPALTLDHLRSSAESPLTSAALHVLLCSSQVSADLHSSIQHLQQEAASMGALGSFPWEPKSAPLPHPSRFEPRVSTSGRLRTTEQLAWEESCAKQARVKWRNTFARDWGLGSATGSLEGPHPVGYGCRNAGLYANPVEASDQFWPSAFYSGVGSTSLVGRGEESGSSPSFCYLGCCSRIQEALERKDLSGHLKPHYHQRRLDPEELSSRFFHYHQRRLDPEFSSRSHELGHGDTPFCPPSFDGLAVSLETLRAGSPVNVGVTVDGTQREVHVTIHSPAVDQLGIGSEFVDSRGLQRELAGAGGDLATVQTVDGAAFFLPAHNSLEETTGKSPRERSSAVPASFGGSASGTRNSSRNYRWAGAGNDGGGEPPKEENMESSEFRHREESCQGIHAVQKETLRRSDGSVDGERNRVPLQNTLLLARCFAEWRDQVFGSRAAAQALYERLLLRKGLRALRWAVELRQVQVGIAQRRHRRTVLAASFRRWQGATAKQQKERASRVETEAHSKSSLAAPGGEKVAKCTVLCQLSAKCLEAATQYGRAEGNLWLQIHHNRGVDKPHGRVQAVRDMRRLAAAFRLWRLQKESLDAEESRAQEARALLEKKRLRNTFRTWRGRHRATERILPLMAQIQRRLLSQCFDTWKSFAEREAHSRRSLDRRRIGVLRLGFRMWALMVRVRERARKTLLELLALRQRIAYARFGFALSPPKTQPHLNAGRQSQRNGPDALDCLYVALVLQEMFYTWKARWCQQQRLGAFRQAAEQRLLREALDWWRWRTLSLPPLRRSAWGLGEEPLLASLDLDESSVVSSGFHSSPPTLPASSDSLERVSSLTGSSPGSVSSLVTITDPGHFLHHLSPTPAPSPGQEEPGDEAVEFCVQASSPLRNINPDCGVHSIAASSSWEVSRSGGDEKEILEDQRQLLARCFALWSSRTLQNLKGQRLRRRTLLSRAFISWSLAAARTSAQHRAHVCLQSARQRRLLAFCFGRWKTAVWRARQRREGEGLRRRPAGGRAVRRWRKAVRGYQALRPNTGTEVQQSCNYWTKAAAFHLCLRERSSLIGAPKFLKMPLSWPSKQRRSREEGPPPSLAVCARLNGSAFHVWLMVYRCQSRAAGPSHRGPPDGPGRAEWRGKQAQIRNSSAEMDSTRWLWRKYLRLWRHNVLLRRFQDAWKMRYLVGAWLLWKDACRTEWVVQALARQRLAQWGWKAWRRRYLQTRVAERFLESQDRSLLKRAFETWRRLAANDQPQRSF